MARETLLLNARILTLDAQDRIVEALAIRDERIHAVGSIADVRREADTDAAEVDLAGQTLIPGFVDAHSHLVMVGELAQHRVDLNSPPIGRIESMAQLVASLRARAENTASGDWIVGQGYDDTLLAERRHPTRRDLDGVSTQHPVVALHISGHLAGANSRALALAGIDRDAAAPEGGVIRRDATGEPDGVLEETAMFGVLGRLPVPPEPERISAIAGAAASYAKLGVTTAQQGFASRQDLLDLDAAIAQGRVPIRVVAWPGLGPMRELEDGRLTLTAPEEQLEIGAVKLFADGSIQGYTGHLCQPYHTPFQGRDDYRGYPTMERARLARRVSEIYAAGRQVAVHVNGDAAIDDFLYAVEQASKAHPNPDARPIAVHAQMAREDQLDTMKRLGVVPSFFCLHTYYWGDRHRDVFLGRERAERISPTASARDRGMRFTIHTDAPVVPMNPALLMWSAVNRRTTGGLELGGEQCLTPIEALRATTIDAAWQLHLEASRGSIEVGKLADLALLDGDPLADPAAIREIGVVETFVGGRPLAAR